MNTLEKIVSIATLVQGVLKIFAIVVFTYYNTYRKYGKWCTKDKCNNDIVFILIQLAKIALSIIVLYNDDVSNLTFNEVIIIISFISGYLWIVGFLRWIYGFITYKLLTSIEKN